MKSMLRACGLVTAWVVVVLTPLLAALGMLYLVVRVARLAWAGN